MKKTWLVIILVLCGYLSHGQSPATGADTVYTVALKGIQVNARFTNDTERYRYNQMKYNIQVILPYLNAATKLFREIDDKFKEPDLDKRDRRKFVKAKEAEMRTSFEDKVRDLNVTQGVLLVKLIARQTDVNIYKMISEFKSSLAALKWQGWARLHGMNLDRRYDPEQEPMLELIMEELGYPLPGSYALNNQ